MRLCRVVAVAGAVLAGGFVFVGPAHATPPTCADPNAPLTVEEQRLAEPATGEILRRTGFDRFAAALTPALCTVPDADAAEKLVATQGQRLWTAAVDRAQGRAPAGDLSAIDDRPLYWARLELTSAVRQWTPSFDLPAERRAEVLAELERTSRGQDSVSFPHAGKRILLTGFDPFQLDDDIRRSNPSGVTALTLDGVTIDTPSGPATVETMTFPVLWEPFTAGVVEHALLPHLSDVDMFTTVSQGRPGKFDLERYNGRWRGGFADNNRLSYTGVIPIPADVPTVTPAPEFVPTTLPYQQIIDTVTGRFPIADNTSVVEIPAGQTQPVTQPNGPTPGSVARAGGGGDYLSNEIAYRATLLRDALGLTIPGGHVHTPVLQFAPGNTTELTDPTFETNQHDIAAEARAILEAAAT
jgi:pyrrolidone-carboxylate peptidase